jgi:hypothetical protein
VNASIEAARAGNSGRPFGIVATNMSELSEETSKITEKMRNDTKEILNVGALIKEQAKDFRGNRLSDLALVNIDLIDRNLYERTADVRWWATDGSVVNALTTKTLDEYGLASKRLGTILQAYTVYGNLVLADMSGKIVASAKSSSMGADVSNTQWFTSAMRTKHGGEFGFQTVHHSPLIDNNLALVYSCAIREGGDTNGDIIGVLGGVFNWESFSQTVIAHTPIHGEEKIYTRICIVDDTGLILADSRNKMLSEKFQLDKKTSLFSEKKNYLFDNYEGMECCIAHAKSPGFEGYSTGWHSLIIQKLRNIGKRSR